MTNKLKNFSQKSKEKPNPHNSRMFLAQPELNLDPKKKQWFRSGLIVMGCNLDQT